MRFDYTSTFFFCALQAELRELRLQGLSSRRRSRRQEYDSNDSDSASYGHVYSDHEINRADLQLDEYSQVLERFRSITEDENESADLDFEEPNANDAEPLNSLGNIVRHAADQTAYLSLFNDALVIIAETVPRLVVSSFFVCLLFIMSIITLAYACFPNFSRTFQLLIPNIIFSFCCNVFRTFYEYISNILRMFCIILIFFLLVYIYLLNYKCDVFRTLYEYIMNVLRMLFFFLFFFCVYLNESDVFRNFHELFTNFIRTLFQFLSIAYESDVFRTFHELFTSFIRTLFHFFIHCLCLYFVYVSAPVLFYYLIDVEKLLWPWAAL